MDFAPNLCEDGIEGRIVEIADLPRVKSVERGTRHDSPGHCVKKKRGGRSAGDHQPNHYGAVVGFDVVPLLQGQQLAMLGSPSAKQAMRGDARCHFVGKGLLKNTLVKSDGCGGDDLLQRGAAVIGWSPPCRARVFTLSSRNAQGSPKTAPICRTRPRSVLDRCLFQARSASTSHATGFR